VAIARHLSEVPRQPRIHVTAVIEDGARIGADVDIGPFAVVGSGAHIGDRVVIGAHSSVGTGVALGADTVIGDSVHVHDRCIIGERCLIDAGAVIGGTGFGFLDGGDGWEAIPQVGRVRIGSDVYVGVNTTIDRGTLDDTVIGDGVKLDNQIQVAHNVVIGNDTIIAGCTGIAGSARIGSRCRIGGRVSILGHLEICDGVQINATSVVTRSLSTPGVYSSVVGVQSNERWRKNSARIHRLDELERRLRRCERRLSDGHSPADPTGEEPVE
jgi:UDP-3-O-[3-hydroxymyristoyl] glucosamine N-acyltransferase